MGKITTKEMERKVCITCGKTKDVKSFYKCSAVKSGLAATCIDCNKIIRDKYKKSKKGVLTIIYLSQTSSSKKRGHDLQKYSKIEFIERFIDDSKFSSLYNNWIKSDYNKEMKPSCDRINDNNGYSFDNIQWMTWSENRSKYHKDKLNGIVNNGKKSVVQIDKDYNVINIFISAREAERVVGYCHKAISGCCNNDTNSHKGYYWSFLEDVSIVDGVVVNKKFKKMINKRGIGVVRISENGDTKEYVNINLAVKDGFNRSNIHRSCKNNKMYKNFYWEYIK